MLSFKAIIAALAFHAVTGAAAPAESSPDVAALAALAQASIYACEHKNWDGACTNVVVSLNSCSNVPSGWNDRISSIRNDSKAYYKCTWYQHGDCKGNSYANQEDANLGDGNGKFNDAISSWSCRNK